MLAKIPAAVGPGTASCDMWTTVDLPCALETRLQVLVRMRHTWVGIGFGGEEKNTPPGPNPMACRVTSARLETGMVIVALRAVS